MRVQDAYFEAGRPVAFFPALRAVTGSLSATVLLCQLLYWTGRESGGDGWIHKTAEDLREETGLTYEEQKSARARLKARGLLEEHYRRGEHEQYFRVNLEALNRAHPCPSQSAGEVVLQGIATVGIKGLPRSASRDSHDDHQGNPTMPNKPLPCSLIGTSEITSETTSETAPETKAGASASPEEQTHQLPASSSIQERIDELPETSKAEEDPHRVSARSAAEERPLPSSPKCTYETRVDSEPARAFGGGGRRPEGASENRQSLADNAANLNMPAAWNLAHGLSVTEQQLGRERLGYEAAAAFEAAMGVDGWPWASNRVWEKMVALVSQAWKDDPEIFHAYVQWMEGEGKFKAMSVKQIRVNPRQFIDTGWPMFLASRKPREPEPIQVETDLMRRIRERKEANERK